MILALILEIHLLSLSLAGPPPAIRILSSFALPDSQQNSQQSSDSPSTSGSQQPQSQSARHSQSPPDASTQAPHAAAPAKPSAHHRRKHKKAASPNCSNSPALDPAAASTAAPADTTKANPDAGSANSTSAQLPLCPPPKKVIRNGGSKEPTIQLSGGTAGEQASQQQSTGQLTAATNDNLKKIAGRQLSASQQEMMNQIKQFMDQSKAAITAGDPQRGHSLAAKAHLLSEELVKP